MRTAASTPPYIPLLVSEISAVKSMERWNNTNVKVFGRLQDYDPQNSLAALMSVDEPGMFKVKVNLELTSSNPLSDGNLYMIFGELDVLNGTPVILAKIVRECNTINTKLLYRTTEVIWKRFPHILK